MSELSFKNASAIVFDPVSTNRNATRNTLYTIGFREIEAVGNIPSLAGAIAARNYDILVLETQGSVNEACDLVRDMRAGQHGLNPFSVVMLTAWDLSHGIVSAVLQSGADDLIARPFSIAQFEKRIRMLVEGRKHFVVTSNYIGPDRRRDPTRHSDAKLIEVPNTLRGKVVENATSEDLDGAIRTMQEHMARQRLERLGAQIAVSAEVVMDWAIAPEGLFDPSEIDRLRRATLELRSHTEEGALAGAEQLCQGVLKVCDELVSGTEDPPRQAALLKELAKGIQLAIHPDRSATEMEGEIADAVAGLKTRRAAKAAS